MFWTHAAHPRRSIGDLWRFVKVHSLKWLAMCSSGCPTPKLQLVLFSETADQWQLRAHCCIQSLQLTAMAEDLPCKLGTSVEMAIPYFIVFFDCMSIKKDFLTVNVLDTLTLQLLVGPRHSIFTSIHCSKQASPRPWHVEVHTRISGFALWSTQLLRHASIWTWKARLCIIHEQLLANKVLSWHKQSKVWERKSSYHITNTEH